MVATTTSTEHLAWRIALKLPGRPRQPGRSCRGRRLIPASVLVRIRVERIELGETAIDEVQLAHIAHRPVVEAEERLLVLRQVLQLRDRDGAGEVPTLADVAARVVVDDDRTVGVRVVRRGAVDEIRVEDDEVALLDVDVDLLALRGLVDGDE